MSGEIDEATKAMRERTKAAFEAWKAEPAAQDVIRKARENLLKQMATKKEQGK